MDKAANANADDDEVIADLTELQVLIYRPSPHCRLSVGAGAGRGVGAACDAAFALNMSRPAGKSTQSLFGGDLSPQSCTRATQEERRDSIPWLLLGSWYGAMLLLVNRDGLSSMHIHVQSAGEEP